MMLKSVLSILGTRIGTRAITVAAGIVIARIIGVEEQGVLGLLLMLGGLMAGAVDIGLGMGAVYFVGRQGWTEGRFAGAALPLLTVATTVGIAVFAWLASSVLLDYSFVMEGGNLAALGLFIVTNALGELFLNLYIARERLREFNLAEIFSAVAMAGMSLLLVWRGVDHATPFFVVYGASRSVVFLYLLARLGTVPRVTRQAVRDAAPLLRYGFTQWLANQTSQLSVRVDALMLAWFIPRGGAVELRDLGLYSICLLTVTRVMEIQRSIQTAFFSRVANVEPDEAIRVTNATYRASFLVYLGLSGALIGLGWPVLWLYGPEYPAAWGVMSILVLGTITLRGNAGVLMLYFSSIDKSRYTVHTHLISLTGNILLGLWWIPAHGIMGAACATAVSFTLGKVYLVWRYQRSTGSHWRRDLVLGVEEARQSIGGFVADLRGWLGARA